LGNKGTIENDLIIIPPNPVTTAVSVLTVDYVFQNATSYCQNVVFREEKKMRQAKTKKSEDTRAWDKLKARTKAFIALLGISATRFQELREGALLTKVNEYIGVFQIAGIADDEKKPVNVGHTFGFPQSEQFQKVEVTLPIILEEYDRATFIEAIDALIEAKVLSDYGKVMTAIRKSIKIDVSSKYRYWLTSGEKESTQAKRFREGLIAKGLDAETIADMMHTLKGASKRQR